MPVLSKYFDEAAFRMCAFGAEAFASAPLHEHLGCGSSHSPEILAALAALAAALAALADLAALPIRSAVAASAPAAGTFRNTQSLVTTPASYASVCKNR